MSAKIKVAILEDHQSIIDGYSYRLSVPECEIVGMALYGEDIEKILASKKPNVLILDANVRTSPENPNPFPILSFVRNSLQKYLDLKILVISMLTSGALIEALVDTGVSGYIFKDDESSILQLFHVIKSVAEGGIYFSPGAWEKVKPGHSALILTDRQLEALSVSAAYPDLSTYVLAQKLAVSASTFRNLLSGAYKRLGVSTRAAAIVRANQLGLLANANDEPDLSK
ncbi:MAG TPA: response regulator transcription factor [Anaerolineaceae bacterium]